jgi:hypothetical protein
VELVIEIVCDEICSSVLSMTDSTEAETDLVVSAVVEAPPLKTSPAKPTSTVAEIPHELSVLEDLASERVSDSDLSVINSIVPLPLYWYTAWIW